MYLINEHYFIVFECEWREWILAVDLLSLLLWITRLVWSPVPGVFTRNRTETKKDASNPLIRAKQVRETRQHATCYSGFGAGTKTQTYLVTYCTSEDQWRIPQAEL